MPDLEEKIQGWKKQMMAAGIKAPVPLDELESHLREEIESQIKQGLAEAEAFAAATKKIGGAGLLKEEFDQARRERERERLHLVSFATLGAVGLYAGVPALFRMGFCSQMSSAQQASSLLAALLMVAFGMAGRWGRRIFPVLHSRQIRKMIGMATVILVALWESIFFFVILQRGDFNMGELITVFYWAFFVPMGFAAGLVMGIENAARKSLAAAAS